MSNQPHASPGAPGAPVGSDRFARQLLALTEMNTELAAATVEQDLIGISAKHIGQVFDADRVSFTLVSEQGTTTASFLSPHRATARKPPEAARWPVPLWSTSDNNLRARCNTATSPLQGSPA